MKPLNPGRVPKDIARTRAEEPKRSVALAKHYSLELRSFDGVVGVQSLTREPGAHSTPSADDESTGRIMGVMTEPFN